MIRTKQDLRLFLNEDKITHSRLKRLIEKFTYSDQYPISPFMIHLRHVEYYTNKRKKIIDYLPYLWHLYNYRKLRLKFQLGLPPNVASSGFHLVHTGFIRIGKDVKIGTNCTILPMVLIGRSGPGKKADIIIGNNCYISTGATIIGPSIIGNNVTIAAGAVVTKDIPDNCIVGGVPAKIIKYKS